MDYSQAQAYLDGFVNFERRAPGRDARAALSLEGVRELSARLGEPWRCFDSVHVAGTKGKGSTCAFAAALLRACGWRVGLYVSPHLQNVRERISINGAWITKADFARILSVCVPQLEAQRRSVRPPTYFEILTHLAFAWFAEQKVDAAVLEVGLGGRLDATNIVRPAACAVSNISLDHVEILGGTVELIAREKAGIFKPGVPIVSAPQSAGVMRVLSECAQNVNAPLEFVGQEIRCGAAPSSSPGAEAWPLPAAWAQFSEGAKYAATLGLRGAHQIENWALGLRLADRLCRQKTGRGLAAAAVETGSRETQWPGRLEVLNSNCTLLILDGAHNAYSLEVVLREVRANLPQRSPLVCLFGCAKDKDSSGMLAALSREDLGTDKLVLTDSCNPRGSAPLELLADWQRRSNREACVCEDPAQALELSTTLAGNTGAVLVTGSLYLVGKIRGLVLSSK